MKNLLNRDYLTELFHKLENWIINDLPSVVLLTIIFFITLKVAKTVTKKVGTAISKRTAEKIGDDEAVKRVNTLTSILGGAISIVLWTTYLMMLMNKLGVDIGPILASAGIIGLAVGFGSQELVRDFISGFFLLLEDQVREGDVAIINGTGGYVEKIELRTITLRDQFGSVHIFQNGKINSLTNMTKEWSAMVFNVGVSYTANISEVMEIMEQVGADLQEDEEYGKYILEPIEVQGLEEFADSAIIVKAKLKTKPIKQWKTGRAYRLKLKEAFDAKGIEIPFPQTVVHWSEKTTENPIKEA